MSLGAWFRPPRHLLALFLLITLVPSTLLIVSGWQLLEQDAAVRAQQAQGRREQVADLTVSSLQQTLDAVDSDLERGIPLSSSVSADSIAVTFSPEEAHAVPAGRLLYYPVVPPAREAPPDAFALGEQLEFREKMYSEAVAWFRQLAASSEGPVRAGAYIRQARNLQRTGDVDGALEVLGQAASAEGGSVAGVPADLFARWAECSLLEQAGRGEELRRKAAALLADLVSPRWTLDRVTFELHMEDAAGWAGEKGVPGPNVSALALSAGVERLWARWQARQPQDRPTSGREVITLAGRSLTLLWHGDARQLNAFVAGPDFVEREWLDKMRAAAGRQLTSIALRDGPSARGPSESTRPASETGLPWTLSIADLPDAPGGGLLPHRRRILIAGLALLAVVVVAGTTMITRAAGRELAVVRLQTDFVAAVSHEFRTPLTSLRQITEVLSDGRVASEERRQTYYEALSRQTERLHQLVEALLDFGRMESGSSPYRLEPLDACAWARALIHQFNGEVTHRGYHVELQIDAAAAPVSADPLALTNALWNLLDNAVKYSPDCRTVWVEVARDRTHVAVRVRDRGLGIPVSEQKEIFRRFVRGREARDRNIRGTGIGLAMVAHIVAAHGGDVQVESQPGTGSVFTLRIPCIES